MQRISPERKARILAKLLPPYNWRRWQCFPRGRRAEAVRPVPFNRLNPEEEKRLDGRESGNLKKYVELKRVCLQVYRL